MRVVEYAPHLFGSLQRIAEHVGPGSSLTQRAFVDHYYAGSEWCSLLMMLADDGSAIATIGLEKMPFVYDSQEICLGCGSNFYSLRPGVGSYLFLSWLRLSSAGLVLRGTEDTHRILRSQKWMYIKGVRTYELNRAYLAYPAEAGWRVAAKWVMRHTRPQRPLPERVLRMVGNIPSEFSVREERRYTQDLLPRRSPFRFRFAPSADYLNWRYNTSLSFVRYRLFRVLQNADTVGYVILNDSPDRIVVAQCDGEDVETLAYGVVLSVLEATYDDAELRPISLASSHAQMQVIYEQFGFKERWIDRSFAVSPLRNLHVDPDTSSWLVNLDWGDDVLFGLFLEPALPPVTQTVESRPITGTGG
ncbi:MAG TPA: hypothetical protein VM716_03860 [Gemmatimonadales bacterium]|nr:hypothetical protein [Gemmatimonadales bacterium]